MFERFTQAARAVVENARDEAARCGDRQIGSDHLLLALLGEDAMTRIVGADPATARATEAELDRRALAAIGLWVGEEWQAAGKAALGRHVPLTSGAKSVIKAALRIAAAEKARTITSRHFLLALLERREPDPAAALLAALAVDRSAVRDRLAATG